MGYAVLHLDKAPGNEARMTAHIERTQMPKNADPERTHLNRELIEFPEGVTNRTEAIQHRLNHAELTRKVGKNQVKAIRIMLTGSNEDMKRIMAEGRLDQWCADNLDWIRETWIADNLVSAVLHLDEATPHIHATVVPIVTGERRKAKEKKKAGEPGKKKYRKKNPNAPRLCVDDIMTRENLKLFQDGYAAAMAKYGLERGIVGSEARHITTQEFYRNAIAQQGSLQEDVEMLIKQREELQKQERQLYDLRDEAKGKFYDMEEHRKKKEKELAELEWQAEIIERRANPDKYREDFELLLYLMPKLEYPLQTAKFSMSIGIDKETVRKIMFDEAVSFSGTLYSNEFQKEFKADNVILKLRKDPLMPAKSFLTIDGRDHTIWFKEQVQKMNRSTNIISSNNQNRGRGI